MESKSNASSKSTSNESTSHTVGSTVVYGLHGKCKVVAIESKTMGDQTLALYKLEPIRGGIAKPASSKREPAIWVPLTTASQLGLRTPMTESHLEAINSILSNREYYFSTDESWHIVHPKLEAVIRTEGAMGLAKVYSYLYVLRKRLVVVSGEINRFWETVGRLLLREICDLTQETQKPAEERINKLMRSKLLPDS